MSDELRKCPFCGAKCEVYEAFPKGGFPWAFGVEHSDNCPITDDCTVYKTEAEAIAAWNTRAPDPSAEVIAQFQAERDDWKIERSVGQIQIETLFEVIAGLVAALKPFAEAAAHLGPIHIYPEGATTMDGFTPMEFICAAQALARAKELRT